MFDIAPKPLEEAEFSKEKKTNMTKIVKSERPIRKSNKGQENSSDIPGCVCPKFENENAFDGWTAGAGWKGVCAKGWEDEP